MLRRSLVSFCLLVLALSFLGCRTDEGEKPSPEKTATTADRIRTVLPPDGDVASIVKAEYENATAQGRTLVVYLGATWCEPCQRFHHAVDHGDLDSTFPKLTLLEFDADHDNERLRAAGYASRYIPLFALPKPDGTASGKQVEGGIKGDGAATYVAEKLKGLLHST
jgi:thiol-disulfide isomerase/thioredoxin